MFCVKIDTKIQSCAIINLADFMRRDGIPRSFLTVCRQRERHGIT